MSAKLSPALRDALVSIFDQCSTGPVPRDLDSVDWRSEELIIPLYDAQIATYEDQSSSEGG